MDLLIAELWDWIAAIADAVPGRAGRLLRRWLYRAALAESGPILSVGRGVEIACPRNIRVGNGIYLVGGAVLRLQTFTEFWTGVHNAWGGAFYGNVARNFLRYGYWTTAFAPVVNSGVVEPSQFEIYYHHPPMTMWLVSLSFRVFGVHEWSARLVPLVFSFLTMALVFQFARSAYGKGAALCALVVMSVLPAEAYYATHVDPYSSVAIFFTALVVEGYRRWLASGRRRNYAIMVVAIALGCATSWFTYLVIPGIVAHGWLIHRPVERRAMLARLWPLSAVAVTVFVLFIVHRHIALTGARPEVFDALEDRLVYRVLDFGGDRGAIMWNYLRQGRYLYTLPVVTLSAAWLSYFLYALWKRRLQPADWCIFLLWLYGLLYALAFPGHLRSHDFFVRTYAPGVALACGVVLWRLASAIRTPSVRLGVIGVALTAVCTAGINQTLYRYSRDNRTNGPTLHGFGQAVAAVTTPRDPVFLPFHDAVLQYYVDRPMTFAIDTPEKLQVATADVAGRYLVIVPERSAGEHHDFLTYLRNRYPERRANGLFMFFGNNEAENTSVSRQ